MPLTKEESFEYSQDSSGEIVLRSHRPPLNEITDEPPEDSAEKSSSSLSSSSPQWGVSDGAYVTMVLQEELEPPKPGNPRLFLANITTARKRPPFLPDICYYGAERDRFEVVAEIFDPLHFQGSDASSSAELAYARAVENYDTSMDDQNQSLTEFHGSYTLRVPVDDPKRKFRDVWVILRKPCSKELDTTQTMNKNPTQQAKTTAVKGGDTGSKESTLPKSLRFVYNPDLDSYYYADTAAKANQPEIPVLDFDTQTYMLGREFTLLSHIPPNPSVATVRLANVKPVTIWTKEEKEWSSLKRILEWPPLPGQDGVGEVKVKLVGMAYAPLDNFPYRFKAIVSSGIPGLDSHTPLLAEVYDPLCYTGINASIKADVKYSRAATAYRLLEDLQGKTVPKFYGTYTMKLPVRSKTRLNWREVRVILREIVEGTYLTSVEPESLNRDQRKKLIENVLQAFREFEERGVGLAKSYGAKNIQLVDKTRMDIVNMSYSPAMFSRDFEPTCSLDTYFSPGGDEDFAEQWSMRNLRGVELDKFVDWDWNRWIREKFMGESFNGRVTDSPQGTSVGSTQSGKKNSTEKSKAGTKRKREDSGGRKSGKQQKND